MRSYSLSFVFWFAFYGGYSQAKLDSIKQEVHHIVKLSPFHVLNFYPTLQFAYELQWHPRFSLQADIGYVLNFNNVNERFINKRGVKLKTEFRYYLDYNSRELLHYFAAEPYQNIINFDRRETQTECFDIECMIIYSKQYFYKVRYRESGFSLKYGIMRERKRIVFDINFGLTLRFVNYKKPDIPRGFNEFDNVGWFSIPNERKRVTVGPALGLRMGYRIK